jgi:DNA-binding response OmpR family regulator
VSALRRIEQPITAPVVLVVDDDQRVLELLEIAFHAHGFKVVKAADGDEAIHRIASTRPDLLVIDVRLPKKSGLEVCEIIRRDPIDSRLPVIVVSGAAETEARLRAFTCGADDFVAKPFSPKELIARMRRLLARTAESRAAEGHVATLEHELQRVKRDVQQAHQHAERERRLREAAFGPGRDLQRSLDLDEICRALLVTLQIRTGLGTVALLLAERDGDRLVPRAIRGDGLERLHGVRLTAGGGVAEVVSGLGRLVKRDELDGLRDLREELAPLIANGFGLLAPLRGPDGLVGLLLAEEARDGRELERAAAEEVMVLCDLAAIATLHAAHAVALLEALAHALQRAAAARRWPAEESLAGGPPGVADVTRRDEAREIVTRAAATTWLPPRQREVLALALELGMPEADLETLAALERHARFDPTGRIADLLEIERMAIPPGEAHAAPPELRRAALLLFVARRYVAAREGGTEPGEALTAAGLEAGEALDPATAQALNGALREYA